MSDGGVLHGLSRRRSWNPWPLHVEMRDDLGLSVVEEPEVLLFQAVHGFAIRIPHDHAHQYFVAPSSENRGLLLAFGLSRNLSESGGGAGWQGPIQHDSGKREQAGGKNPKECLRAAQSECSAKGDGANFR